MAEVTGPPSSYEALEKSDRPWYEVHWKYIQDLRRKMSEAEGVDPEELRRRTRVHFLHAAYWVFFYIVLLFVAMFGLIAEF